MILSIHIKLDDGNILILYKKLYFFTNYSATVKIAKRIDRDLYCLDEPIQ